MLYPTVLLPIVKAMRLPSGDQAGSQDHSAVRGADSLEPSAFITRTPPEPGQKAIRPVSPEAGEEVLSVPPPPAHADTRGIRPTKKTARNLFMLRTLTQRS